MTSIVFRLNFKISKLGYCCFKLVIEAYSANFGPNLYDFLDVKMGLVLIMISFLECHVCLDY